MPFKPHTAALGILFTLSPLYGQSADSAQNRKALLLGMESYASLGSVDNAVNDTATVAAALKKLHFDVATGANLSKRDLTAKLREFTSQIAKDDVVLVYYSGLALQANQENYLLPVDFRAQNADLFTDAYSVSKLDADLSARAPAARILVLDACSPVPALAGRFEPGLAFPQLDAPGVLISLATQPGKTTARKPGAPGVFAQKLAEALQSPSLTIEQVFQNVQGAVAQASSGAQIPTYFPLALKPIYLAAAPPKPQPTVAATPPPPAVPETGGPKSIFIKRFAVAQGVTVPEDLTGKVAAELARQLPDWGHYRIVTEGDPAAAGQPPSSGLVIEGEIVAYKAGSRAARVIVGYGVGGTILKARVWFFNAATKSLLYDCNPCEGHQKGNTIGGGKSEDAVRFLAAIILEQASKQHLL